MKQPRCSILALALVVHGCGHSGGAAPDAHGGVDGALGGPDGARGTVIGPAGGTLTAGGATITIPPGALAADTALALEVVTSAVPLARGDVAITPIVRATPHGTTFAVPITVVLPIAAPPPVGATLAARFLRDDADATWHALGAAHADATTVTFTTSHLSLMRGVARVATVANPCGAATGYAADSPWPTMVGCETNRRSTFAIGPQTVPSVRWKWTPTTSQLNQAGTYGPVIDADGALYMVSVYDVTSLSPAGVERWRVPFEPTPNAIEGIGPAVLAADGSVIACAPFRQKTVAFDPSTGAVRWQAPIGCGQYGRPPTLSPDGTLVALTDRLLSTVDGAQVADFGGVVCEDTSVVDADGTTYCGAGAQVHAIARTGAAKWTSNLDGFFGVYPATSRVRVGGRDTVVFVLQDSRGSGLHQYNAFYDLDGPGSTPNDPAVPRLEVAFGGYRAITAAEELIMIDGHSSTSATVEKWSTSQLGVATPSATWTAPSTIPSGRSAPIVDGNGDIYYGTGDGYLVALAGATGQPKWSVRIGAADGIGPLATPAIASDGTIYVVGFRTDQTNAFLYALAP